MHHVVQVVCMSQFVINIKKNQRIKFCWFFDFKLFPSKQHLILNLRGLLTQIIFSVIWLFGFKHFNHLKSKLKLCS